MAVLQPDQHPDPLATDESVLANIRTIIDMLLGLRGMKLEEVADAAGISRSVLYTRMGADPAKGSNRFTVPEIVRIGRVLRLDPELFFEPAENLLRTGSRSMAGLLELVPPAAGQTVLDLDGLPDNLAGPPAPLRGLPSARDRTRPGEVSP
jgi:predicted DNA-binding transcriptional regulator AlpA